MGRGSIKKLADTDICMMQEKSKHVESGLKWFINTKAGFWMMKSLTMDLISTASMGKVDLKLSKEPEAPTSLTVKNKKSKLALFELEKNRG